MNRHIPTLVLLGLLAALWSCNGNGDSAPAPAAPPVREVQTSLARPVTFSETVFATGRLSSKEEARLSFKTGGIIRQVYVREGESVRQGQLLAELDLDEIRAQTQQARLGRESAGIDIENAKLALRLAERDYQNVQGLYRDSVATLEQLQNAQTALDNARNQLEAAKTGFSVSEQQVNVAAFNLKYSKITAPANGVILRRLAEPNELVGPGSPVFLFGSKEEAQVIKVNITDKDIIFIDLGDKAEVTFDAYPGDTFRGVVREVASMADPYTSTYEVEVEVYPDGRKLLNGFIGSVHIFTGHQRKLMEIPVDALYAADRQEGSVFVVRDSVVTIRRIAIARIRGDQLLVEDGLKQGEQVVVTAVGYLEDRQRVTVKADTGISPSKPK